MEGTNCGGEGGWTRVAYVNMTQPGATYPQGLDQQSLNGNVYCGRFSSGPGCVSAFVDTAISYQQVCGRVVGYQNDDPDGFALFYRRNATIDEAFFDGLSIMYGTPRRNIWTYAAGFSKSGSFDGVCPCNNGFSFELPPYIGNDYYCEILEVLAVFSTIPIHCGTDSSVVVMRLPAAHTPICHGSSRHSVRPSLRTLN